ncbi:pyridoxal phosphate-dependent transferase [Lipomyces kononenkoae]|uniref:Pyridoxal phosphate-dependent transferase n=1 Tax=Lipomyces kononenkoae TaxID=34357 RepID=A0ACC3T567_LIPKO
MAQVYKRNVADIRSLEYPGLSGDMTYLDHAGTTLYAKSLMDRFCTDMTKEVFGNPHSASPSSMRSTQRVENVRLNVLRFFNADPEHFDVVFVANATAAVKSVLDAFRDVEAPGFWYGYHSDAHTSLVGLRQHAAESRCFESDQAVDQWLEESACEQKHSSSPAIGLFAYPAQSNMNGHRLPLDWASRIRNSSHAEHQKMYILLDAAAYVTTCQLDLSDAESAPDFIALSFYKIFGFPDLGALIVRKSASDIFRCRRYFGGGTVEMVTAIKTAWHAKKEQTIHDQLEDGTLAFHSIIALGHAFNLHEELYGSMDNISRYTCALALDLYNRLVSLRHWNGQAVCEIYKNPDSQYGNSKTQGPTIAFNIRNPQGGWVGKSEVESLAVVRNIHLRAGGVCNPGGIATFCHLDYWELRRNFFEGVRCGNDIDIIGGKPTGIVRVSLGAMSSQEDVNRFVNFVDEVFVEKQQPILPAALPMPIPSDEAEAAVERIQVFPIMGCLGWQVPQSLCWEIRDAVLEYDWNWCVVRNGDTTPLDHPGMQSIRPQLDLEEGILKLTASIKKFSDFSTDRSTRECHEEITIPLWDVLSNTTQPSPRLEIYDSKAITSFFTAALGIPSTLARFNKIPRSHWNNASSTALALPHEQALTLSAESQGEPHANVILSGSSRWKYQRYIRIGQHYFEILQPAASQASDESRRLVHLPNIFDRSLSAQHPSIRSGDYVQTFSADTASHDPALCACIVSRSAGRHLCPVVNCRRDFHFAEDLLAHFRVHDRGENATKISNGSVGKVDIDAMLKPTPKRWRRWKLVFAGRI